jgi:hypothetical protein
MTTAKSERKKNQTTITASVAHDLKKDTKFAIEVQTCLNKFLANDWGTCSENDKALNDSDPSSAMGNYPIVTGSEKTLWVKRDDYGGFYLITILYPSDY